MNSNQPLAEVLHTHGLRMTAPRQLVLDTVRELVHATPEQVHAAVAQRAAGINITTVYRTLELLEELGLVTHAHLGRGAPTYHGVGSQTHAHLVCRGCGTIGELPEASLRPLAADLLETRGFRLDISHVALFGRCADCRAGSAGPEGTDEGGDR